MSKSFVLKIVLEILTGIMFASLALSNRDDGVKEAVFGLLTIATLIGIFISFHKEAARQLEVE